MTPRTVLGERRKFNGCKYVEGDSVDLAEVFMQLIILWGKNECVTV